MTFSEDNAVISIISRTSSDVALSEIGRLYNTENNTLISINLQSLVRFIRRG